MENKHRIYAFIEAKSGLAIFSPYELLLEKNTSTIFLGTTQRYRHNVKLNKLTEISILIDDKRYNLKKKCVVENIRLKMLKEHSAETDREHENLRHVNKHTFQGTLQHQL